MVEKADSGSLWQERGWTESPQIDQCNCVYGGEFQLLDQSGTQRKFQGLIRVHTAPAVALKEFYTPSSMELHVYIRDLPEELRNHPKGHCFQLVKAPWFRLHYINPPSSVDAAILHMEQMLHEAFQIPTQTQQALHGQMGELLNGDV